MSDVPDITKRVYAIFGGGEGTPLNAHLPSVFATLEDAILAAVDYASATGEAVRVVEIRALLEARPHQEPSPCPN